MGELEGGTLKNMKGRSSFLLILSCSPSSFLLILSCSPTSRGLLASFLLEPGLSSCQATLADTEGTTALLLLATLGTVSWSLALAGLSMFQQHQILVIFLN